MSGHFCPRCGFVVFPRPGGSPPPESCPRCEARGHIVRLLASQPGATLWRDEVEPVARRTGSR
jgi:hypothetical protein